MGTGKLRFTEFKYNPDGCTKAKEFLLAIGKWTDDVGRRDGWEIVGKANTELRSLVSE